jgi:hypothetical protein
VKEAHWRPPGPWSLERVSPTPQLPRKRRHADGSLCSANLAPLVGCCRSQLTTGATRLNGRLAGASQRKQRAPVARRQAPYWS